MTAPGDARALLLVLADPPPPLEEEFNDWYDTEHLPERAAVPGIATARRYRGLGDGPAYAALYDLDRLSVLDSAEYRAVSGANFSPWTRRVTARVRPRRLVAVQAEPGGGITPEATRLVLVQAEGATAADLPHLRAGTAPLATAPGLLDLRFFIGVEADFLLAVAALAGTALPPLRGADFGPLAGRISTVATFRTYRR